MQNNEKPIVFLSHSSLDKAPLAALKQILDERAAGSLNFFLSSDGESIRLGRNWVVSVSDALSHAKLMFVFLSAHSAESKWIHFEAGCAYAKNIQVVPVCLPGIDLNRITPPLSLLQGFNLHSHETMGNLARICNETFNMKVNESFGSSDFDRIVKNIIGHSAGFFGDQTSAIDSINIIINSVPHEEGFNPIPRLNEICQIAGLNCHSVSEKCVASIHNSYEVCRGSLELPGCIGSFVSRERPKDSRPAWNKQNPTNEPEAIVKDYVVDFTLSPELFHVNAPLFDKWFEMLKFKTPVSVVISFRQQIACEMQRHHLTTKLNQCGISIAGPNQNDGFLFDGFKFRLYPKPKVTLLSFEIKDNLEDKRLSIIIERLFKYNVLCERQLDLAEMFQGA